jgi:hypothetical protein
MDAVTGGWRNLCNEELHNFNAGKYVYDQMKENEICGICT